MRFSVAIHLATCRRARAWRTDTTNRNRATRAVNDVCVEIRAATRMLRSAQRKIYMIRVLREGAR